jgi:hypothetical protein
MLGRRTRRTLIEHSQFQSEAFDQPSRGLWLVQWILLVPHYIILFLVAFVPECHRDRIPRNLVHNQVSEAP